MTTYSKTLEQKIEYVSTKIGAGRIHKAKTILSALKIYNMLEDEHGEEFMKEYEENLQSVVREAENFLVSVARR